MYRYINLITYLLNRFSEEKKITKTKNKSRYIYLPIDIPINLTYRMWQHRIFNFKYKENLLLLENFSLKYV